MNSIAYKFTMEEEKPIFTPINNEPQVTPKMEHFPSPHNNNIRGAVEGLQFPRLNPSYQNHGENEMLLLGQQEPKSEEIAPTPPEMDDVWNFNVNGSDIFEEIEQNPHNFYMGANRSDSGSLPMWNENDNPQYPRGELNETFDFLVKSLLSANNFVSTLTREQLSVLRSIRPSLLYDFLQEVAKVRSERRMRRALPNECAFCKNNGENEECYSSHALKDWRGRVLCPVLRAFRCPRCGATGDRAHTIKYCPENADTGSDRSGSLSWRRRVQSSLLVGGPSGSGRQPFPTPTPAPSPSPASAAMPTSSIWTGFGMN